MALIGCCRQMPLKQPSSASPFERLPCPLHLHCPLSSHSTSRSPSSLKTPRHMRLDYLPKPSCCWEAVTNKGLSFVETTSQISSVEHPQSPGMFGAFEEASELELWLCSPLFLQHPEIQECLGLRRRPLRPGPAALVSCLIANSRGCSNCLRPLLKQRYLRSDMPSS